MQYLSHSWIHHIQYLDQTAFCSSVPSNWDAISVQLKRKEWNGTATYLKVHFHDIREPLFNLRFFEASSVTCERNWWKNGPILWIQSLTQILVEDSCIQGPHGIIMATKSVASSEVNASDWDFIFGSKFGPVGASFTACICVVWLVLVLGLVNKAMFLPLPMRTDSPFARCSEATLIHRSRDLRISWLTRSYPWGLSCFQ